MIKSIHLRDFQAHPDLEISFSPSITSIRGPSDRGKSSILRALRWICLNDLPGEDFIREGAKYALVKMEWKGGEEIGRGKGSQGNIYTLDEDTFRAFGSGVPDAISRLLRLSPLNFQGQHDPPFWFAETAGEISRQLNAVIDLSVIDLSLVSAGSRVRTAQERRALCQERVNSLQEEWEGVSHQRARVEEFRLLQGKLEGSTTASRRFLSLTFHLAKIDQNPARTFRAKAQEAETLLEWGWQVVGLMRKIKGLSGILGEVAHLQGIRPPPDFARVEGAFEGWTELESRHHELALLLGKIIVARTRLETRLSLLQKIENRFHDQTKGSQCPACGQIIR